MAARAAITATGMNFVSLILFIFYNTNLKNDNLKNAIHLLKIERCHLLEKLHHEQKKIDCLDYLIYSLKDNNQK